MKFDVLWWNKADKFEYQVEIGITKEAYIIMHIII